MTGDDYWTLPALAHIYLEDSFVLGHSETDTTLVFMLQAVLTPEHPHYHPALPNQAHCYRQMHLIFPNVTARTWHRRSWVPFTDATGTIDYGNIDSFITTERGYDLDGSWGHVTIQSDPPRVMDSPSG